MPQNSKRIKQGLRGTPRSQILRNVQPMLCRMVKEPFDRTGWIFEIFLLISGGPVELIENMGHVYGATPRFVSAPRGSSALAGCAKSSLGTEREAEEGGLVG